MINGTSLQVITFITTGGRAHLILRYNDIHVDLYSVVYQQWGWLFRISIFYEDVPSVKI